MKFQELLQQKILFFDGAMGTMLFVLFGSLLSMVAVVFLVTRKKMSVFED